MNKQKTRGPGGNVQAGECRIEPAIDLRDWFAGMALQGLCCARNPNEETGFWAASGDAYDIADFMLAERERQLKSNGGG